jgi:hypothetical protein
VDDRIHSLARGAERGRIRDVPDGELDTPGGEARATRGIAHERPHRRLARAQRVDDVRPDEARAAGDENRQVRSSKFFQ